MQKRMVKTENILSATQIKAEAARLGFSACGLAPAEPVAPLHAAFFKRWLGEGRQAGMAYKGMKPNGLTLASSWKDAGRWSAWP